MGNRSSHSQYNRGDDGQTTYRLHVEIEHQESTPVPLTPVDLEFALEGRDLINQENRVLQTAYVSLVN